MLKSALVSFIIILVMTPRLCQLVVLLAVDQQQLDDDKEKEEGSKTETLFRGTDRNLWECWEQLQTILYEANSVFIRPRWLLINLK